MKTQLKIWMSLFCALGLQSVMFAQEPPEVVDTPPPPPEEIVEEVQEPVEEVAGEVVEEAIEEEQVEEVIEEEPVDPELFIDPDSPYLYIHGADIHTVTNGVIQKGDILCKDGRVMKLGESLRKPHGARQIDASGMQIYPGLIAVESSGIVSGRGLSIRDSYDPYALNIDLGLSGGLTTVQSGGAVAKLKHGTLEGILLSETKWVNMNYSTTSPSGRRKLREDFSKVRDFLREEKRWVLDKALGEDVSEEAPEPKDVNKEYLSLLKGEAVARFSANSLKDLLATCDLLEEYPMQSVIMGGREAWACAGRLGRVGAQLVITPRAKSWADDSLNRPSGWSIENARILWDHGVSFSILPAQRFISTGGIAGRDLLTLPMEAAFAIRGGLPQDVALRSITLDAAKLLGVDHRLGSIEVGKDADFILCDGDLFHYRTFVQWAVVDGAVSYDKMKAPYFAHIRPRAAKSLEEVIEEIQDAVVEPESIEEVVVGEAPSIDDPEEE